MRYSGGLWRGYENGGYGHVAAYLVALDITSFDPKAPPPKTVAFWDIVDANRAPEDAELADALDELGNPEIVTLGLITSNTTNTAFCNWIKDPKNRRILPHRFERCGYTPVRNDAAKDGMWKIHGRRQVMYAKNTLSIANQIKLARDLSNR
jgi:hypothetical protein